MSPQTFVFYPQKDPLICRWLLEIRKRYPRTANKIVLFAINYFIKHGDFAVIAKMVPTTEEYFVGYEPMLKKASTINVPHDDLLDRWFQHLDGLGINRPSALRMVITQSIQIVRQEEDEAFLSLADVIMSTNGRSSLTGKVEPVFKENVEDFTQKDTQEGSFPPVAQTSVPEQPKIVDDEKYNFMKACSEFALEF